MTPHEKLANWVDEIVIRSDSLVSIAKGNHCLTRADGDWSRSVALKELFTSLYEEKTVSAIMLLLEPDFKAKPMTGLERFDDH